MDANANIIANTEEDLNTRIEKNAQLVVEQSNFRKITAEVKDKSALVFSADATVGLLEMKLKDSAVLRDNNANISKIIPSYISDKASLSLSGKGLGALILLSPTLSSDARKGAKRQREHITVLCSPAS